LCIHNTSHTAPAQVKNAAEGIWSSENNTVSIVRGEIFKAVLKDLQNGCKMAADSIMLCSCS
jgi:hypothetical protein